MRPLGLYIHVPFCAALCGYCNFTRGLRDPALERQYVAAVGREIRGSTAGLPWPERSRRPPSREALRRPGKTRAARESTRAPREAARASRAAARASTAVHPTPAGSEAVAIDPATGSGHGSALLADTIYFGGGTPSVLEPGDIAAVIRACRETFEIAPGAEVTMEANPETVTPDRLAGYRAAGVNRVSFGVQSFSDAELVRLGRLHDAARARAAFHDARSAGFDNLSLDLMLGLPGQTLADLTVSVDALVALGPEHASVYLLEVHPGTPLAGAIAGGDVPPVADDDAADMYLETMARLESAGYEQYEISNVARPGHRSRHNVKYWTDGEWLGFGCAAHSTLRHERWNNVASARDYVRTVERGDSPVSVRRPLSSREQLEEALFMELRLTEGIDLDRIRRVYGVDVWQQWGGRLAVFEEAGLLVRDDTRLRLTRRGMLLAGSVMTTFLEDVSTVE
jgi:oxygen-independent coproporphyrinogen-3 oxidase